MGNVYVVCLYVGSEKFNWPGSNSGMREEVLKKMIKLSPIFRKEKSNHVELVKVFQFTELCGDL